MASGKRVLWNELVTTDQKACGDFFAGLLGWDRKEVDMGPMGVYTLFQANGEDVAGMMNPLSDYSKARPPFWAVYVEVDDVDECAAKVKNLGGAVIAAPEDIPDVGRVCMISDPTGAPVCLMKPVAAASA